MLLTCRNRLTPASRAACEHVARAVDGDGHETLPRAPSRPPGRRRGRPWHALHGRRPGWPGRSRRRGPSRRPTRRAARVSLSGRTSARTGWPTAMSFSTMWLPNRPVAPVTRFICLPRARGKSQPRAGSGAPSRPHRPGGQKILRPPPQRQGPAPWR